jgi:hypothetical protein
MVTAVPQDEIIVETKDGKTELEGLQAFMPCVAAFAQRKIGEQLLFFSDSLCPGYERTGKII